MREPASGAIRVSGSNGDKRLKAATSAPSGGNGMIKPIMKLAFVALAATTVAGSAAVRAGEIAADHHDDGL